MAEALAQWYSLGTILGTNKHQKEVKPMKRDTVVKAMVPKATKEAAVKALDHWGLSLTDAINIYLVKVAECGGIPFDLSTESFDWDDPSIPRAKAGKNGGLAVPKDWLDDDD